MEIETVAECPKVVEKSEQLVGEYNAAAKGILSHQHCKVLASLGNCNCAKGCSVSTFSQVTLTMMSFRVLGNS